MAKVENNCTTLFLNIGYRSRMIQSGNRSAKEVWCYLSPRVSMYIIVLHRMMCVCAYVHVHAVTIDSTFIFVRTLCIIIIISLYHVVYH